MAVGKTEAVVVGMLTRLYRECRTARYASNLEVSCRQPTVPVTAGEAINLCWGASGPNFGDALSPLIVHLLSGRPLTGRNMEPYSGSPRLLALGTIIERAHDGDMVWGSGCRNGEMTARSLDVRAVRGPLTRDYLLKRGIDCPQVYGDPAMLMPWLYRPEVASQYDIGVIQHYADRSRMQSAEGLQVRFIDVTADPLQVIDEMCSCRAIVSSSLHGLILADSYGIPACWLYPGEEGWSHPEPEMKYRDYFLSTGREGDAYSCGRLFSPQRALELAHATPLLTLNPQQFLANFPYLRAGVQNSDDLFAFRIRDVSVAVPAGDLVRRAFGKLAERCFGGAGGEKIE